MSTTAKKPDSTPIPVQLSEHEFTAFIFPHLSMPNGKATGGVIQTMPRSATVCVNGREMMMEMADVKCTATPVRGWARHFGRICAHSAGSISDTCISMSRRMKPWSIRNG